MGKKPLIKKGAIAQYENTITRKTATLDQTSDFIN
jgi:hypothetical protein